MRLFFPVHDYERDAPLSGRWRAGDLAGLDKIEWETSGADHDAIWVAIEVPELEALQFEEPDSRVLGHRSFVLPEGVMNSFAWHEVPPEDVARAREGMGRLASTPRRGRR